MSLTTASTPTEVNQGSSNTSRNILMPASLADGDSAVLAVMVAANVVPTITAAGLSRTFTLIGSVAVSGKALHAWEVTDLEVADSGETVTISTGATSCKVSAIIEPIRGGSLVNIVDTYSAKNGTPASDHPTTPLLTTTRTGCGILYIVGMRSNDTGSGGSAFTSISPVAGQGITEDADAYTTGTASLSGLCVAHDWTPRANGATVAAAEFEADHSDVYCALTISIRPGNLSPVAEAGADVEVDAGDTAYITSAQATDEDGTVVSTDWTWVSYPTALAPTITGGTTLTPSFPTTLPGEYKLLLTVEDNNGATHTDEVSIWAVTTTPRIKAITAAGGWTAVGAASIVEALEDDDPDTYAQSGANPAGDTLIGELEPVPAGAKSFTTTVVNDVDSPTTNVVLTLINRDTGTTVATETVTGLTTTPDEVEWVLDGTENGAVVDPHKLNIRFVATTN